VASVSYVKRYKVKIEIPARKLKKPISKMITYGKQHSRRHLQEDVDFTVQTEKWKTLVLVSGRPKDTAVKACRVQHVNHCMLYYFLSVMKILILFTLLLLIYNAILNKLHNSFIY
jgi:hypothetical protein